MLTQARFQLGLSMLLGDDSPFNARVGEIPLLRIPGTGLAIKYAESSKAFAVRLRACGYSELANGLHSLRIGGNRPSE
jgi:hypothetical protein